jgi:hypothetical protein
MVDDNRTMDNRSMTMAAFFIMALSRFVRFFPYNRTMVDGHVSVASMTMAAFFIMALSRFVRFFPYNRTMVDVDVTIPSVFPYDTFGFPQRCNSFYHHESHGYWQ